MIKKRFALLSMIAILILVPVVQVDAGIITINHNLHTEAEGYSYSGIFPMFAGTYCEAGVDFISIFIGYTLVATEYDSLINFDWDTTSYSDGSINIMFEVHDLDSDSFMLEIYVLIDNIPDTTTTTTTTTDTTSTTTTTDTTSTTTTTDTISTTSSPTSSTPPIIPVIDSSLLLIASASLVSLIVTGMFVIKMRKGESAKVLILCPYCASKTEQGLTTCNKCGADI